MVVDLITPPPSPAADKDAETERLQVSLKDFYSSFVFLMLQTKSASLKSVDSIQLVNVMEQNRDDLEVKFKVKNREQVDASEFLQLFCTCFPEAMEPTSPFAVQHYTSITCLKCKETSVKNAFGRVISLCIGNDAIPLQSLIEKAQEPSKLDSENMWGCPKCKTEVAASQLSVPSKLSDTVILQLNRFSFDKETLQGSKLQTSVDCPLKGLQIPTHGANTGQLHQTYELVAAVEHRGTTPNSGHYLAYTQRQDKWYQFDDIAVHPKSAEDVKTAVSSNGYLLFYRLTSMPIDDSHMGTVGIKNNQNTCYLSAVVRAFYRRAPCLIWSIPGSMLGCHNQGGCFETGLCFESIYILTFCCHRTQLSVQLFCAGTRHWWIKTRGFGVPLQHFWIACQESVRDMQVSKFLPPKEQVPALRWRFGKIHFFGWPFQSHCVYLICFYCRHQILSPIFFQILTKRHA